MSKRKKLPKGWRWAKLGDNLLDVFDSGTWGKDTVESGTAVLRSNNIQNNRFVFESNIAEREIPFAKIGQYQLRYGDIVMVKSSGSKKHIGKCAIYDLEDDQVFLFSNFTQRLRANPSLIDPFYLYFYLTSDYARQELERMYATSSGLRNIQPKVYEQQEIPLPPLAVQERIVEVLQQADVIRRKRAEARRLADQILPALFLDMFGDPATNPKAWPVDKLGKYIAEWQAGFASGKKDVEDGIRQLRMNNITTSGWINLDLVRTVPRHKKHDFYLARNGDVIFNNTNSPELVGKTILFPEEGEFYFSNHLSRIRTTDRVTNEWLAGLLHVLWAKSVFKETCRQWVNQASVSKESVLNLDVPIPSPTALLNHREALEHLSTRRDGFAVAHLDSESLFSVLLSLAFTGELTAEWEAANADWIAERQAFYKQLPRLALLALLLERCKRAGRDAVTLITALMKYAFLAQMEGELHRRLYRFVPYHYGPCAMELYEDLKALESDGLITVENNEDENKTRITLTDPDRVAALLAEEAKRDDARLAELEQTEADSDIETDPAMSRLLKRRAETLEALRADAETILDTYGDLDHNRMLETVYAKYPAYAKKSRVVARKRRSN